MRPLAALNAGLLLGAFAGFADGLLVVLENPRSFPGGGDATRFVAASLALYLGLGAGLGGGLAVASAAGARVRAGAVLGTGLALALFLWVGIRVHVRFLFGEPLLAPASLGANAVVLVGAIAVAAVLWRWTGGRWREALPRPGPSIATGLLLLASAGITLLPRGATGPPAVEGPTPPAVRDLLLVTLDTTRADHLSCYGYPRRTTPFLDRLARRSDLATETRAPIPLTNPSHCSLFTGVLPRDHGVVNNGMALPDSVATFVPDLARAGFECAAFVSGIPLKRGLSGLAPGFRVYDDTFSPLERVHPMMTTLAIVRAANRVLPTDFIERRAAATCGAAIRWLRESEGPRFVWVHLFDPHSPYDAPPLQRARFARESPGWQARGKPVGEWPVADYDAEIAETDRALGELLRAWDDVTRRQGAVVVTADHGEGLGDHGELTHGALLFEPDLRVPLLLAPSGRGIARISRSPGSTALLAGILPRLAGIPPARTVPGGAGSAIVAETFAPEGRENKSATMDYLPELGQWGKLIVNWETGEEIAFLLGDDPGETRPVDASGSAWDELRRSLPAAAALEGARLDPETERRLRALGYVH